MPEARVAHPYWRRLLPQVWGWAKGDVLCLDDHPRRTFYALPNWAEYILLLLFLSLGWSLAWLLLLPFVPINNDNGCCCSSNAAAAAAGRGVAAQLLLASSCQWLLASAARVVVAELLIGGITCRAHAPQGGWGIAFLGACFPAAQDVARLLSKLRRGRVLQLCLHFDWMDGQGGHVAAVRLALLVRLLCFVLASFCGWCGFSLGVAAVAFGPWHASQYYSKEVEVARFLLGLQPLPLRLGGSGGEPPVVPFVVLSWQRSGSNLLCGMLHNHPGVTMHNEILNDAAIHTYTGDLNSTWDTGRREADPVAFLADALSAGEKQRRRLWHQQQQQEQQGGPVVSAPVAAFPTSLAAGFKLFPEHWRPSTTPALQRLMADKRVRKVVLRRRDLLAVFVSKLRADKSGRYLGAPLDDVSVRVDPAALQSFVWGYNDAFGKYCQVLQGQARASSATNPPAPTPPPGSSCPPLLRPRPVGTDPP